MKTLHDIAIIPFLSHIQMATIGFYLAQKVKVRVRTTPVQHKTTIEIWQRNYWNYEMAWMASEILWGETTRSLNRHAAYFQEHQGEVEFVTGRK